MKNSTPSTPDVNIELRGGVCVQARRQGRHPPILMKLEERDYTWGEWVELVKEYRQRYCQNNLAVYPPPGNLKFLDNKRVVYLPNKMIRLEAIWTTKTTK